MSLKPITTTYLECLLTPMGYDGQILSVVGMDAPLVKESRRIECRHAGFARNKVQNVILCSED